MLNKVSSSIQTFVEAVQNKASDLASSIAKSKPAQVFLSIANQVRESTFGRFMAKNLDACIGACKKAYNASKNALIGENLKDTGVSEMFRAQSQILEAHFLKETEFSRHRTKGSGLRNRIKIQTDNTRMKNIQPQSIPAFVPTTKQHGILNGKLGFTSERKKLHKEIINEMMGDVPAVPKEQKPVAVIIIGGAASGKSTLKDALLPDRKFVNLESDEIKAKLPEYQQALKEGKSEAALIVHDESLKVNKQLLKAAIKEKKNLAYDGTGANIAFYKDMIKTLKSNGYEVNILLASTDQQVALDRARARQEKTGRMVPDEAVIASNAAAKKNFLPLADLTDNWAVYDMGGSKPVLKWTKTGNAEPEVKDEQFVRNYLVDSGHTNRLKGIKTPQHLLDKAETNKAYLFSLQERAKQAIEVGTRETIIAAHKEIDHQLLTLSDKLEPDEAEELSQLAVKLNERFGQIETALSRLQKDIDTLEQALSSNSNEKIQTALDKLLDSYGSIPLAGEKYTKNAGNLIKQAFERTIGTSDTFKLFEALIENGTINSSSPQFSAIVKIIHNDFQNLSASAAPETRLDAARILVKLGKLSDVANKRDTLKTTAAILFRQSADGFIARKQPRKALEVLQEAGKTIEITQYNPLYRLDAAIDAAGVKNGEPTFLEVDSSYIENRTLRVTPKLSEHDEKYEIEVQLTPSAREQLEKFLPFLEKAGVSIQDGKFEIPVMKDQLFTEKKGSLGPAKTINIGSEGKITLGSDPAYHTTYYTLKIETDNPSGQKLQRFFSILGLPMALLPSRDIDIAEGNLAKAVHILYPSLPFNDVKQLVNYYTSLSPEEKSKVDSLVNEMTLKETYPGHMEYVAPSLGKQAWEAGGRGYGTMVQGGSMVNTSKIFANILKGGNQSQMERYRRGIAPEGDIETKTVKRGSADKVFFRPLAENQFDNEFSLDKFHYHEDAIFILYDQSMAERGPSNFDKHVFGIHNHKHVERGAVVLPEIVRGHNLATPIRGLDYETVLDTRKTPAELARHTNEKFASPLSNKNITKTDISSEFAEVTFDSVTGPDYIYGAVVPTEEYKQILITQLNNAGIFSIRGKPLEEAIFASTTLKKEMLYNPWNE